MKVTTKLLGAIALALFSPVAVSADWDDGCSEVLRYSARDYSVEKSDIGIAVKVYDQYCENASVKGGTNFSAGLDTVIKAVPLKFSLGSGSTEERTKYFCKTFDLDYKRNENYYRETSKTVSQTTTAWLACKTLASQGVIFRPQIAKTQILIEIARKAVENVVVQGIQYDEKLLSCTVPNSDSSKIPEKAKLGTTKTLEPGSWTVTCVRTPQEAAGETIYPEADISVGTTKGPFLLPVAGDASFPYQWASDLQKQMKRAVTALEAARTDIEALRSRAKILAMIRVQGGKVVSGSDGVTFDQPNGLITFPNSENRPFVPVISDFQTAQYITETHFVREIAGTNQFKVWRKPLDTGARNSPPSDFTAIVVGF